MAFGRTVTGWLLVGLLGGALAEGCGSSSTPPHPFSNGAAAGGAGRDGGIMTVEPPGNSGNGGESQLDPLCGIPDSSSCVPDLELNDACRGVGDSSGSGGRGSATGGTGTGTGGSANATAGSSTATASGGRSSGTGGSSAPSGTGGTSSSPAGAGGEGGVQRSEGGAPQGGLGAAGISATNGGASDGQGGEGGAGQSSLGGAGAGEAGVGPSLGAFGGRQGTAGSSTSGGSSSMAPAAGVSCQVTENPNHKGSPLATCRAAGTGIEGSPCFSGADCAPTYACVGDGPGQCRAYCCAGPSECMTHTGTHCAVAPLLLDTKSTRVLEVPVCMPPVKCSLAEKYPCTAASCSCPTDSACVVVSDDGATSCVAVSKLPSCGMGQDGQACPCAPGFVCSQAKNTCVELCEVAAADATCGSGRCQASAALPAGWGTCVGTAPKDAGAPRVTAGCP